MVRAYAYIALGRTGRLYIYMASSKVINDGHFRAYENSVDP